MHRYQLFGPENPLSYLPQLEVWHLNFITPALLPVEERSRKTDADQSVICALRSSLGGEGHCGKVSAVGTCFLY